MNVKKNRERECWGSKGQRVGEGEKGEGRGADTRRADFSQISLHLCDKKGNNSFRWGNLQRDTFHLPLHCVRQITGNTEEKEREASLARMWADVLKCTQHRLFQMYKIRLNINTFILEEKKLKFIPTLVLTFWINFIYHCNNFAGACFDDTDAETNWQVAEFGSILTYMLQSKHSPRLWRCAGKPLCDCKFTGLIPAIVMCAHQDHTSGFTCFSLLLSCQPKFKILSHWISVFCKGFRHVW